MKHQKIITHVSTSVEYESVKEKFKEEWPDIEIADENEFLKAMEENPIALIATKLDDDLYKMCFSDSCMKDEEFRADEIYQGEDFDKCVIQHVDDYLGFAKSGSLFSSCVFFYDRDENEIARCATKYKAKDFLSCVEEAFVYFNNKTINIKSLEEDAQEEMLDLLFE